MNYTAPTCRKDLVKPVTFNVHPRWRCSGFEKLDNLESRNFAPLQSKKMESAEEAGGSVSQAVGAFPTSRVKRIIRSEFDIKTNAEALFLINKATEKFLECFAKDAFENLSKNKPNTLAYTNLSSTVASEKRYEFLTDFVPQKVKAKDALSQRSVTEN
eukprot:TRINITY_DN25651_c0_g1_i1.p1 TRINITY_DN25651_c0_g1~~TRINITY_DN25651_c0_g1_i1.p1  ORF type:complete len:158 (+),score=25.19 TRINITY_DN25651_c0_g1_i1:56-529(+)